MDSSASVSGPNTSAPSELFSGKNAIIIVLLILLVLSFVGVNLLIVSGNILNTISNIFGPVFVNLLSMLGYSTGELINTTSEVVADTAKLGIDVANGTVHSVGNLLKSASQGGLEKKNLEQTLKTPKYGSSADAVPISSTDSIVSKGDWCYIGEYAGSRGCVAMAEHSKCMSGQVFASQSACMRG